VVIQRLVFDRITGFAGLTGSMHDRRKKLDTLRQAIQKGFDAIDQGRYITINSREELSAFMESVSATKPADKLDEASSFRGMAAP